MKFLILMILIQLCLNFCNCTKLICDGEDIDEEITSDVKVFFDVTSSDANKTYVSGKFNPSQKTVVIIHGFSLDYQWAYQMATQWLTLVNYLLKFFYWSKKIFT